MSTVVASLHSTLAAWLLAFGAADVGPVIVPVHGDADWIRRGGYQDRNGDACCGEDDCYRLSPADVREAPGGFLLLGRFIPHAQARPSEDGHYWACYSLFKFRCFFYPAQRF